MVFFPSPSAAVGSLDADLRMSKLKASANAEITLIPFISSTKIYLLFLPSEEGSADLKVE